MLFFFPFLLFVYFRSVYPRVVSVVSCRSNQPSFALFYVVFVLLYRRVNTIFNTGKSSSDFFSWPHRLKTSSLVCKALCIVIRFLVLCSIYSSSSLVHFNNSPEYLTWGTAQVFTPFICFLLYSLVSSTFLLLQRFTFLCFSFISSCLIVSVSNISQYLHVFFFFSERFKFSWFGSYIPSVSVS